MHGFSFTSIDGAPLPMSGFAGQAVLVVNTASFCGFTRQYGALQQVFETYRARGLVVLGVPSTTSAARSPAPRPRSSSSARSTSRSTSRSPRSRWSRAGAHPFFRAVVAELGPEAAPRWNFHKFCHPGRAGWRAPGLRASSPTRPSWSRRSRRCCRDDQRLQPASGPAAAGRRRRLRPSAGHAAAEPRFAGDRRRCDRPRGPAGAPRGLLLPARGRAKSQRPRAGTRSRERAAARRSRSPFATTTTRSARCMPRSSGSACSRRRRKARSRSGSSCRSRC